MDNNDNKSKDENDERKQKFQSELFCNSYLPYIKLEHIDDESNTQLNYIKQELGRSLALRDINPGTSVIISKLISFIKLYGLKFSKEDHVNFVNVLLKLIAIDDLDPSCLNKFCICLHQLLRKSHLLSPNDLEIEWKPLYKLSKIYIDKRSSKGESVRYYSTLEQSLIFLIQLCSPYFKKSAAQEIFDEFLPQMQPLDIGKSDSCMEFLTLFLNPDSYEVWFDKLVSIWDVYHFPPWNVDMMNLISTAAAGTIGLIDWNNNGLLPIMFTRIIRSLDLPVCYKQLKSARSQSVCADASASFIVAVLGPKVDSMKYFKNLMCTLESYLHPANSGKWTKLISELLKQLVKYFHNRLICERHRIHPWKRPIPEDFKLREEDITEFVNTIKPVALQAMYSKIGSVEVGKIFKGLADLRPELILPDMIERVLETVDSFTEPHKYTAALQCLSSVSYSLATANNNVKSQVIPILFTILPGIDSNDYKKTSITLQYIMAQSLLIPFVDCSKASFYHELDDEESLICEQTAQLEDFVMQFLDRIFQLIESSSIESTRMEHSSHLENLKSKLDSIYEALIQSSLHSILGQCSQEILSSATNKLMNYIKSHVLEPRVAGVAMAGVCRIFARVNGFDLYKALIPYLINFIELHYAQAEDICDLEKQSDEFLYHLIILSHVIRGHPVAIQTYIDDLIRVFDKLLKSKCKMTSSTGVNALVNLLTTLSNLQTDDIKTASQSYNKDLKDYLPIRDWGRKMESTESFQWFLPGQQERNSCEKIIHHFLVPILEKFNNYIEGSVEMSRDDVLLSLQIVTGILKCNNFLNNWEGERIELYETVVKLQTSSLKRKHDHEVRMPNGENVRLAIYKCVSRLQEKILDSNEDDIKSLKQILAVYEKVHIQRHSNSPYESQLKVYKVSKQFQEFKLCKDRKDIRAVVATRVMVHEDLRSEIEIPQFTKEHRALMLDLVKLSTSHYSVVRSTAQSKLFKMFKIYSCAYRTIIDDITIHLQTDPNENHEAFKGALYLIGSNRRSRLIVRPDWVVVSKLWMTLLKTQLSEKISVLKLMESIADGISSEFQTIATELMIDDEIALIGSNLMPNKGELDENFLNSGLERLRKLNSFKTEKYFQLLTSIVDYMNNNHLHWRYRILACSLIANLLHPVSKYTPNVTELAVNLLISDSVQERTFSLRICNYILKQQKRSHQKIAINPFEISGMARTANNQLDPGFRMDNEWLQYDNKKFPKSQAEWDEPRYIFKINGFFGWTSKVEIYAPDDQQPKYDRQPNELNEHEKIFTEFLDNKENVDKLMEFWSMEEKKGREKFNRSRFWLIKCIFDAYGLKYLDTFTSYLPKLIENKLDKSHESSHRCAAEVLAGIIRGAKHWNYEMTEKLYQKLDPIIRLSLNNITNETDGLWGTAYATAVEGMDPMRQYFLHEILLENPIREDQSFVDCSRLYCLQGAYNQHVWRMNSVAHRLLDYLSPYLNHPFQIIRERIASTLINIFENDLNFNNSSKISPKLVDLMTAKSEELLLLSEESDVNHVVEINSPFAASVRFFKTLAHLMTGILNRCTNGNEKFFFDILHVATRLEKTCEHDVELVEVSTGIVALIAQALTPPRCMNECIAKIVEISNSNSWSVRVAILDFLQVQVFNNMPIILSDARWVETVQEIVLKLLEDKVLEVRDKAAEVLGGLLHCSLLKESKELLKLFKDKCKTKIVKKTENNSDSDSTANLIKRHAGVLGLCAFVTSNPYRITEFMPVIFEILSNHMNDPQPIPSTIRKTIADFKRTHHDGWENHKQQFNESQLAVLNELTVPPSYYS